MKNGLLLRAVQQHILSQSFTAYFLNPNIKRAKINVHFDFFKFTFQFIVLKNAIKNAKTFLGNPFLDIYKCPFSEKGEMMFQKIAIETIIDFYGLVNKKIISTL